MTLAPSVCPQHSGHRGPALVVCSNSAGLNQFLAREQRPQRCLSRRARRYPARMDMNLGALARIIERTYQVTCAEVAPAPRGFAGETYRVRTASGAELFLKLVPDRAGYEMVTVAFPALHALHALGIDGVSLPLPTADGQWSARVDERTLVASVWVPGSAGEIRGWSLAPEAVTYDLGRLAALTARIHAATPLLPGGIPREDFALPFVGAYETLAKRAWSVWPASVAWRGARSVLRPYREAMARRWAEMRGLESALRHVQWTARFTHGDALGSNILVGEDNRLTLIDWDTALIAPAERDIWFYLNDARASAAFLASYRTVIPDYQPDRRFHRYYLFRRFFEDLTDYLRIVEEHPSLVQQQWAVEEAEAVCFGWLWPAIERNGVN